MERRTSWINENKEKIIFHFSQRHENFEIDINYEVKGVFVINAPTLYMYDSPFITCTLYNLKKLLDNKLEFEIFSVTDKFGNKFDVTYPYYKNAEKELEMLWNDKNGI
ncbi:MAG: hypothetical protein ACK4GL_10685 [Flavobacteriales bacterium]